METLLISLFLILSLGAQAQRNCGSMEVLDRLKMEDPTYAAKMGEIEEHTAEFVRNHQGSTEAVINIPVVIHVLYNTAVQNITDAQILSQIDVLNEDFRLLNADHVNTPSVFAGLKADCEINFVLAKRDPRGNATTGIIRKSTTVTSWSSNDYVKYSSRGGDDAWPAGSYLNIWVCNLGSGPSGYAQFPGGAAITDGVVVGYQYFGRTGIVAPPYHKGRIATHEVGHWLNLRHIWGDANCGNDLVDDTPTQQTSNYGCPTHPKVTCSNVNGDLFMNYMDYSDDACMSMFTHKQKLRMQAVLAAGGSRATLATSLGRITPTYEIPTHKITVYPNPASSLITIEFEQVTPYNVDVELLNTQGMVVKKLQHESNTTRSNIDVETLENGLYVVRILTQNRVHTYKFLKIS